MCRVMCPVERSAITALWLFAIAMTTACGDDERIVPVVTDAGAGGANSGGVTVGSSSSDGASSSSAGAGTPVREVFVRNPFGDQVQNLLADGDFEFSITSYSGQHGWIAFGPGGQVPVLAETGGLCRSGLRCARLQKGGILFARGTAAAGGAPMVAELWVRPTEEGQTCSGIDVYAVSCDSFLTKGQFQGFVAPDDAGWCPLRGTVSGDDTAVCLYMENGGTGPILVDQASLRVDDTPDAHPAPRRLAPAELPPVTRANMGRLREHLRRTLPLGGTKVLPPGSPAVADPRGFDVERDPRP